MQKFHLVFRVIIARIRHGIALELKNRKKRNFTQLALEVRFCRELRNSLVEAFLICEINKNQQKIMTLAQICQDRGRGGKGKSTCKRRKEKGEEEEQRDRKSKR